MPSPDFQDSKPLNSRARRFSTQEILLLLIPCLILAGVAIALRGRGGNTMVLTNRFALTVEKYEMEPVTPREVSQGYSAKLKVTLNHVGPTPAWWGKYDSGGGKMRGLLFYRAGDSSRPVLLPPNFKAEPQVMYLRPLHDAATNRYAAQFLIPLARVPARKADVVLQAKVAVSWNGGKQCAPVPLDIVLRKAGEPVVVPHVSTDPQLAVKKIEVLELSPVDNPTTGYDTEVRVLLRYTGAIDNEKDPMQNLNWGKITAAILDSQGRKQNMAGMEYEVSSSVPRADAPYTKTMMVRFSLNSHPRSAGSLFYQGEYSLAEGWPLKMRVPIRDAKGKHLLTTPRGAQTFLKVLNFAVAPVAPVESNIKSDTKVSVALEYFGPAPVGGLSKLHWTPSWSQHLVDEKGKEYRDFVPGTTVGGMAVGAIPSPTGKTFTAEYSFPLKQIPASAGRVWLKAQIAAGNNAFHPVSILVRDTPLNGKPQTPKSAGEKSPAL